MPVRQHVVGDPVEVALGEPRFAPGAALRLLWFGSIGQHEAALDNPAAVVERVRLGQALVAGTYSPTAIGQRWAAILHTTRNQLLRRAAGDTTAKQQRL